MCQDRQADGVSCPHCGECITGYSFREGMMHLFDQRARYLHSYGSEWPDPEWWFDPCSCETYAQEIADTLSIANEEDVWEDLTIDRIRSSAPQTGDVDTDSSAAPAGEGGP